jgi:iron(III) transport system substrate-binding protein
MTITRRVFLASGTAAAAIACSRVTNPQAGQNTKVLNLYSARHYESDNAVYKGFTDKTGIKINLVEAEADKLIERLKSEGSNSPADVILTVDAGRLWRAQQEGLLQPIDSALLKTAIPEFLREQGGHWFGFTRRARVIIYNKGKVKPADLSTYEDLSSDRWKGRLIIRSSSHIYNQSLVGSLFARHGEEKTAAWAQGIVKNFARKPEGNDTAQIKAVASGLADVTLANTYYMARLVKSDKPEEKEIAAKVGLFFPNQGDRGTHINISGGGVVKTSKNRDIAVQFLEYLASPEAQVIFSASNNEYPAIASAKIDPILESFGQFKADSLNAAIYGQHNADALKIMDRAGWT